MDYPDPHGQLQPSAGKPDRLPAELGQPNRASPKRTAMRTAETATITGTITGWKYPGERPPSDVDAAAPVSAVGWCRSVGASWTLEFHQLDGGRAPRTIVDWISSGVPISQPVPDGLARELLAERGLQLFGGSSAGPGTHSRHRIGYVCENAELIQPSVAPPAPSPTP